MIILTTRIFEKGSIPAMSFVAMISSKSNKRIKQAIWKGNANVMPGNVHALVLMMLATNILSITAPFSSTPENNVPLKSVQFSLTKQFAYTDDEFETFAINIDSNWEGIPIDP
jgi:hypothetical protein